MSTAPRRRRGSKAAADASPVALDSSCWMEFFVDSERADLYADAIESIDGLVVPVLTVYEVVKKLLRDAGDDIASSALSLMQRGRIVDVDLGLAVAAASSGLPLADSLIYTAARVHGAVLWTQDAHFEGLAGVRYFAKPTPTPATPVRSRP